jgi:SAM-dependent methyltransferase
MPPSLIVMGGGESMTTQGNDGPARASGTEGYGESADALAKRYESLKFEDVHRDVLHLLPPPRACVVDLGAGTGRDAAALAALGHTVVAVEPTAELRAHGQRLHASPNIEWLDESLPELLRLRARGDRYDVIMATAVWMHMDAAQRRQSMRHVAELLAPGGLLFLTLRHGPVPDGRRMFDVPADETIALGRGHGLALLHRNEREDMQNRPDVRWTCLVLRRGLSP